VIWLFDSDWQFLMQTASIDQALLHGNQGQLLGTYYIFKVYNDVLLCLGVSMPRKSRIGIKLRNFQNTELIWPQKGTKSTKIIRNYILKKGFKLSGSDKVVLENVT
jgi:hypothetical protein